jgi:DNA-binding NtrC family response regulator
MWEGMAPQPKDDAEVTALNELTGLTTERPVHTFALQVMSGPDAGKSFVIDSNREGRVLIGQSPACGVRLVDPTVSRRHVALELVGGALRLSDLGSTNGTWVNGLRVFDVVVTGGERIQIGNTVLGVEPRSDLAEPSTDQTHFGAFIGASAEIRCLYPTMARIASSTIPVVIEGETGTGKEVLAEAMHDLGSRAAGPFVVFDCTTIAVNLMEATLFGHERGSFTGALAAAPGLFEQADKGTLFIDEIGDLDITLQAKLLRAIERSEVRRIGGKNWLRVDVRIIAATRRDLDREVQSGRFRDDLFFRLAVARIELPPLRRRRKDISLLAAHFWKELGGAPAALSGDLLRRLEDYDWPGNVRELRNAITQKITLGELSKPRSPVNPAAGEAPAPRAGDPIGAIIDQDLPFPIARDKVLDMFERRYVGRILERHGGNVTHAAHASGIGRRYFQTIRGRHKA